MQVIRRQYADNAQINKRDEKTKKGFPVIETPR